MWNPKQFFVLFDAAGDLHSVSPYPNYVEQHRGKGMSVKVYAPGSKFYDGCLALWQRLYPDAVAPASEPLYNHDQNPAARPAPAAPEVSNDEARSKAEWDQDSKLQAEFGGKFETYMAYRRAIESGQARIVTGKVVRG